MAQELVARCLNGGKITAVEHFEHGWTIQFDNAAVLNIESVWRLLSNSRIVITSEDDGQQFGLPKPVSATDTLINEIGSRSITDAHVDPATADLLLVFGTHMNLQVVSTSAAYEAWTITSGSITIVGRPG